MNWDSLRMKTGLVSFGGLGYLKGCSIAQGRLQVNGDENET